MPGCPFDGGGLLPKGLASINCQIQEIKDYLFADWFKLYDSLQESLKTNPMLQALASKLHFSDT